MFNPKWNLPRSNSEQKLVLFSKIKPRKSFKLHKPVIYSVLERGTETLTRTTVDAAPTRLFTETKLSSTIKEL